METKEKQKQIVAEGLIKGHWRLTYELTNHNGVAGFGGRMIAPYPDPITGRTRQLIDLNGQVLPGYFITKTVEDFNPEQNPMHGVIIDWLAGHPEVGIQNDHVRMDGKYVSRKMSNPRIKLLNLDHENLSQIDEEDYIDRLVGIISQEGGNKALGLDKLRFVLAKLNLSYREEKFISEPQVEKKKLRKKLKDFTRKSMENAKQFEQILNSLDDAKFTYEIKEMGRLGIITRNNGMYMFEGNPIGTSYESIKKYFETNEEFYVELQEKLYNSK